MRPLLTLYPLAAFWRAVKRKVQKHPPLVLSFLISKVKVARTATPGKAVLSSMTPGCPLGLAWVGSAVWASQGTC